jgi:hypothetical protein
MAIGEHFKSMNENHSWQEIAIFNKCWEVLVMNFLM